MKQNKELVLPIDINEINFFKKKEETYVIETPKTKPKIAASFENSPKKKIKE